MSTVTLALVAMVVLIAAWLQGSVGFGLGMILAPVLALAAPSLLPVTVLLLALVLSGFSAVADRHGVHLRSLAIGIGGRVPGTVLGAWLVARLPQREFALLVAVSVLLGAFFAWRGWQPRNRTRNVLAAGLLSGVMGTATSVGGPPMALVWGASEAQRMRGTLSAFFFIGSLLSLAGLFVFDAVDPQQIRAAVLFAPAMLLGFGLARVTVRHLDQQRTRSIATAASLIGALTVLVTRL
ncbi:sulfite exporter TauE/SafE family protein [Gephyromycinifex aptenodytis]|uniref:sulfite exporter TauE/SafE family protein n=1 Tax=Gephyromycinifex aptenodytis TaxID=2716227 RepID=UPI00144806D6|nr:sulfite exporter TauE/SafE family protein [Gephyromycinifex aptenodytis]